MHKVKIEPIEEHPTCARVYIDDEPVRCSGYNLKQYIGELPSIELEMFITPSCEHNMIVHISNKEEIARLMDKAEFEEFCEIWKEVHDE